MYTPSPLLAKILFIPSLLFEAVVRARNFSYTAGILGTARLPRPVVSVGNVTLGGSGKTPLVIYIARILVRLGHVPAVLSRGYGSQSRVPVLVSPPGNSVLAAVEKLGDEPVLIRRNVREIWLGISADRYSAGSRIAEHQPNVIFVLDDGFQHRRLHRDLDILVIDRTQPFLRNYPFPRGSLREPLSCLKRPQAIVLNGESPFGDTTTTEALREMNPGAAIFNCTQEIGALVPLASWRDSYSASISSAKCHKAFLAAALGNPERFQTDVERLGISAVGCRFFRDHHRLTPRDWHRCIEMARSNGAEAIIITEKDAVKILEPPDFPLLVAVQSTSLDEPEQFQAMIMKSIGAAA